MAINEYVEIGLGASNAKYYKNKGYEIPKYKDVNRIERVKYGTKIQVKVEDLPKGSQVCINGICDHCNKPFSIKAQPYFKRKNNNLYLCNECYYETRKTPYEEIINTCNEKNWELITQKDEYYKENMNKTKFEYVCLNHPQIGIQTISHNNLKTQKGCKLCANERSSFDIEIARKKFQDVGLILIEDIYINNSIPMKCYCEKHKDKKYQYKSLDNVSNSQGCKYCAFEARAIKNKLYAKEHREERLGENSTNWKGGITPKNMMIRSSEEYKQWRLKVFERDNYTCQCCSDNSGGNLVAHHIENFSSNEKLRFDVNNGTTLCDKCHNPNQYDSFHNIYGTFNNTRKQLEQYIQYIKNKNNLPYNNKEVI